MPNNATTLNRPKTTGTAPNSPGASLLARILRQGLWAVATLICCLVAVEAIFAWAHIGEEEFLQTCPTIGYSHIPNKLVTWRSEGYSQEKTNSFGFRDVEWSLAKPAGTKRIAVLGDSMTEGFQVPLPDTFPKALERRLNAAGTQRYEVQNFGMSCFSTVQGLYLFKETIARFQPDIVILAYHVSDNEKNSYTPGAEAALPRPYCGFDSQGKLITNWTAFDTWTAQHQSLSYRVSEYLRKNSRIWAVLAKVDLQMGTNKLYQQAKALVSSVVDRMAKKQASPDPAPRTTVTHNDICPGDNTVVPYTGAMPTPIERPGMPIGIAMWQRIIAQTNEHFHLTAAVINELNNACKQSHARLIVGALPAPNNSALYFRELRSLEEVAKHDGYSYVNIHQAFPSLAPMQKSELYFDIHFTAKGSDLVAKQLADAVLKLQP